MRLSMFAISILTATLALGQETDEQRFRWLEAKHGKNVCGNGELEVYLPADGEEPEQCEPEDLAGKSCTDFGFDMGTLTCTGCKFDLSQCEDEPPPSGDTWERMATPPGGSLDALDGWIDEQCGLPRAQWPVYEVGPGKQYTETEQLRNAIPNDSLAVVRVFHRDTTYDTVYLKGRKCAEVIGVPSADGKLPTVKGVNMGADFDHGDAVLNGGLIVRDMHSSRTGHCVGVPANRRFLVIQRSELSMCGAHAFLTDGDANHLYVRMDNTYLHDGGTMHLAYIDRVARADVFDNRCENPGGGHCIRVVARNFYVARNKVSSVNLDGTLKEKYDKPGTGAMSVGMHPLETYNCSEGIVEDNEITYYLSSQSTPGGYKVRSRRDIEACDLEGRTNDGKLWVGLDPQSDRYRDPAFWTEVGTDLDGKGIKSRYAFHTLYQNNTTRCMGPGAAVNNRCISATTNSNFAQHRQSSTIQQRVRALIASHPEVQPGGAAFVSWEKTCADLASFTTDVEEQWVLTKTKPAHRITICGKGNFTEYIPLPAPDNWRERGFFEWGHGNKTLKCAGPGATNCEDFTPNLQMDDKMRIWFHPGEPTLNIINTGGAVVVTGSEQ